MSSRSGELYGGLMEGSIVSDRNEMTSFSSAMNDMFRRLGLPDPLLVGRIKSEWPEFAPAQWKGRSAPLTIKGRTLVVEASSPSQIAFLRYGVEDLLRRLEERYGPGVIEAVDVRPPS